MRISTLTILGLLTACRAPSSTSSPAPEEAADTPQAPELADEPEASRPVDELRAAAIAAYQAEHWGDCARSFELVLNAEQGARGDDGYNAACCLALAGQYERAFDRLEWAAAHGVRDVDQLRADSDLASLRERPRWDDTVALYQAQLDAYLGSIHRELYELYRADQDDRRAGPEGIDWSVVSPRDEQRRARVVQIIDADEARTGDDWFHAAMIMQHGKSSEDYRRASRWAQRAAELSPELTAARRLAASAEDRRLMHEGKPQRYGTQFIRTDSGWELYEVDPTVTDEERAQWNVPPLAESRRHAAQMN